MAGFYLRTDEQLEAAAALEAGARAASRMAADIYEWRWLILALHNALQGFMVMALRGSDGLAPLRDDVAKAWLKAYRANQPVPEEKLASLGALYSKIKGKRMRQYIHSTPFQAKRTQDRSVKKLNILRNQFVHFLPRNWSLEVSGLPSVCLDIIDIIEFLGWKCGNVYWSDSSVEQRAMGALRALRTELGILVQQYGAAAVSRGRARQSNNSGAGL